MATKELIWEKVANTKDDLVFAENNIAVTELNGKKICIGIFNNEMFAFGYSCPHAGGILANGHFDSLGNVVCPIHRYKFCVHNGRNLSGEGYYLPHWPVAIKKDGIFIGIEKSKTWFPWF